MRSALIIPLLLSVLFHWPALASDLRVHVKSFSLDGEVPVTASQREKVLAEYTGPGKTLADISAAARALEALLHDEGYSFYRVVLPPQKIKDGAIQLQVIQFQIGSIQVTGNKYYSAENIRHSLPGLQAGMSPNMPVLQRHLQIANASSAKNATILIKEGKQQDAIDAEIQVRDRDPVSIYTALGNTGSDDSGDWRLSFGYQHANLFDRDHALTLSYTTSPEDTGDVQQTGIFYRLPVYSLGSEMSAYYIDSTVDSGTVSDFDVSGAGEFAGLHYKYAFPKYGELSHSISAGLEDRYFDNDVLFLGVNLGVPVRSRPISLTYAGQWKKQGRQLDFSVSWAANVGGGSHNDKFDYRVNRAGADVYWQAFRYSLDYQHPFDNGWEFKGYVRGQWSDDQLIPGEQFGLGGRYSLRGFEERELSGDNGIMLQAEAWIPFDKPGLRPYVFLDVGKVDLNQGIPGRNRSDSAGSVGAGMEWKINRNNYLSTSLGHVIDGLYDTGSGHTKLHLQYIYRFM